MRAAGPIGSVALLMAGETNFVLFLGGARIGWPEAHNAANTASAAGLHMRRARTVAVFAFELAFLGQADPAHQGFLEFCGLSRMAGRANLAADKMGLDGRA